RRKPNTPSRQNGGHEDGNPDVSAPEAEDRDGLTLSGCDGVRPTRDEPKAGARRTALFDHPDEERAGRLRCADRLVFASSAGRLLLLAVWRRRRSPGLALRVQRRLERPPYRGAGDCGRSEER